jgi:hypothetical protein
LLWARRKLRSRRPSGQAERAYHGAREVPQFDGVADELFEAQLESYSFVGDRRSAALNCLYPGDDPEFIRLVVEREGTVIGWAVLLDTSMRDHKYFGDLRVGSLADCFAALRDAPAVVAAADDFLTRRGVDVVVSNQLHYAWCEALEASGYEAGPSNFFFYFSEGLSNELGERAAWERGAHLNRGDGEGPTNL